MPAGRLGRIVLYVEPLIALSGANPLKSQARDADVRGADPAKGEVRHEAAPAAWAKQRALHPKLRALFRGGAPDRRRIRRFLPRNPPPLVEPDAVTFLFLGRAEAVRLRHFMRGVPNGVPFERVPGTALWHLRLPLPGAARFEYKLDVLHRGHRAWIDDPHNPRTATDPFGANSIGHSFGYAPPGLELARPGRPGRAARDARDRQSRLRRDAAAPGLPARRVPRGRHLPPRDRP